MATIIFRVRTLHFSGSLSLSHFSSISQTEMGPWSVLKLQAHCTVITIQSAQIRNMPSGNFDSSIDSVCLQPSSLYLLLNMISEHPFCRVTSVSSDFFLWQWQPSRINPEITWQVCCMSGPIQLASTHGGSHKVLSGIKRGSIDSIVEI